MVSSLLVVWCLAQADLQHQKNLVPNPSFEKDRDRDTYPDGWRPSAFESPAQLEPCVTEAYAGQRCLQIRDSFRPGDQRDWKQCTGRWVSQPRPIQPGTEYRLSVWIKTRDVTGSAYAHLAWQRDSHWLSEVATERVSGTSDWRQVTLSAVAPPEANRLVVSLNLARSRGTAWFDDVVVAGISDVLPHVEYVFHDTADWFPFLFPPDDTNRDSIDLSGLLHAPAGKHGFVTTRPDGHSYFEDGKRARFFGTNVGGRDCAPDKELARAVASRLAKYGVNMLRLHSLDSRSGPVIDYTTGTSQPLDPKGLDRVDFFVSELKKQGIYVYLDLLDYRQFRTADGVREADQFTHNWQGSMKGASIFDPRMIELQKDYATRLLTHRNPYTGLRYVDDPAIALIETTNENSLFYFLTMDDLSLPTYRDELAARWNHWLAARYGNRAKLSEAWQDANGHSALQAGEDSAEGTIAFPFGALNRYRPTGDDAPPQDPLLSAPRMADTLRFLAELQRAYYTTMRAHLKQLGVRVPVAGTNQQFAVADTQVDAEGNDFMSRNQYWRHPNRNAQPFFKFANDPLIAVDLPTERNPFSVIARTSVAGKPQAIAEFNFPWPNEYRCEGLLMAAAYACLQDWDVFLLFSYGLRDEGLSMFRSSSDPARWGEFPAAAWMFHRRDVARARNRIDIVHTSQDTFTLQPHTRFAKYTNYRYLTFLSQVRNVCVQDAYRGDADVALGCGLSADAPVEGTARPIRFREQPWQHWLYPKFVQAAQELGLPGYDRMPVDDKCFRSDTGELTLDYGRGLLTINTPCTKAAIGHLDKYGPLDLDALVVDGHVPFAAVTATSLDGLPLGRSRHVLLTCVGRAENTAQGFWPPEPTQRLWSPTVWMLPGEGRPPVLVEPVRAAVRLRVPGPATVYPLDSTGQRSTPLKTNVVVRQDEPAAELQLDPATARSIWCEIVVP